MRGKPTIEARFWAKVDVHGPDDCWPWKASCFAKGYGQQWFEGKNTNASRVAWILTYGPLPKHVFVLHRCDNPPCCNPAHLFTGSAADNTADMLAKGRARGPEGDPKIEIACQRCGAIFLDWASQHRRFCSRSCVR